MAIVYRLGEAVQPFGIISSMLCSAVLKAREVRFASSQGRLLSTLLAAIADFERDLIRERTGEGRTGAMANGVKFGRKRKLSDYQRAKAIKRRGSGETLTAIAQSYGVAISMISRL